MIFPFRKRHQERVADRLLVSLAGGWPPVVHVLRYPELTINHLVLVFDAEETPAEIRFLTYDPNYPDEPQALLYERQTRSFTFGPNKYFGGGLVNVYEIYRSGMY